MRFARSSMTIDETVLVAKICRGTSNRRTKVSLLQIWVILENLGLTLPSGQQAKQSRHGKSQATNARATTHHIGINGNAICLRVLLHVSILRHMFARDNFAELHAQLLGDGAFTRADLFDAAA